MKVITATELRNDLTKAREIVEKEGKVKVVWRQPKPNGKVEFSAILMRESDYYVQDVQEESSSSES